MAEILLSLTIIGVVAAITLPSLTGNINERTWNTQRKALFARFSQAIALMPALNGYGIDNPDTAAETFVTAGLSKVLKINNICDNEHLEDCGFPSKIMPFDGGSSNGGAVELTNIKTLLAYNDTFNSSNNYLTPDTKAAAFETANGESILIYYNPSCVSNRNDASTHYSQPYMCANFIYDLNGSKGPNTMGKDMGFISALYASDPVLATAVPLPKNYGRNYTNGIGINQHNVNNVCKQEDPESRAPNRNELAALFYNKTLSGMPLNYSGYFWSSSPAPSSDPQAKWILHFARGHWLVSSRGTAEPIRCVKRF